MDMGRGREGEMYERVLKLILPYKIDRPTEFTGGFVKFKQGLASTQSGVWEGRW